MLTVSHTDAATVMKAHPARSAGDAGCEVEQCPIGDSIRAVKHSFRLAERACHGSCIEVVPADYDRRAELTIAHHLVEEEPCAITLTIAEPADADRSP